MKLEVHEKPEAQKKINAQVKSWLWRYRNAKLDLRRLQWEYMEMVSVNRSIKAVSYDGMPHGESDWDLSDFVHESSRLEERIQAESKTLRSCYTEIVTAIGKLENQAEKDIMMMRYIILKDGYGAWSMDEIGKKLGYTSRYVKAVHGNALQNLAPIIQKFLP
jgi:DNA-directed RNA polymerase sigma subunit (sigma70/sigma32)